MGVAMATRQGRSHLRQKRPPDHRSVCIMKELPTFSCPYFCQKHIWCLYAEWRKIHFERCALSIGQSFLYCSRLLKKKKQGGGLHLSIDCPYFVALSPPFIQARTLLMNETDSFLIAPGVFEYEKSSWDSLTPVQYRAVKSTLPKFRIAPASYASLTLSVWKQHVLKLLYLLSIRKALSKRAHCHYERFPVRAFNEFL